MWHVLTYFSVCRFYIDQDDHGNYTIKKAGCFRMLIYYGMWINTTIKIIYLILTYRGYLIEIHFLDQMSIWDWFLCFSQLVQETNMWYRKYPMYEVLHANWKIQEEVFRKLGSPQHVQDKIMKTDKSLVIMHMVIVFGGCSALMVQFASAPKYALNTYAVIPFDNLFMGIIFATHEYLYMFHIWSNQASSIVLCEVFASSYTHIIREMTLVLGRLIEEGKPVKPIKSSRSRRGSITSGPDSARRRRPLSDMEHRERHTEIANEVKAKIVKRSLDLKTVVPGTEYDITTLLADYKKMMISTTSFNSWAGLLQGGTTASNYGQFVSDVFMMIQLLKEPETDLMAVFFFMEDACAGMIMLFRMLIIISRLYPASEEFLCLFKNYLGHDVPNRKYLRKYQRTLKIIASKLGGYSTRAITVPKGINCLMNYYIGAAMWQRPVDRRT
ncbi:unnamed protein product [Orchesella dallaii]|uniref:Odorant receptor n=1 Tax=Orchesella dallaii TaxID=48710 RepID=A0ABP1Q5Z1_9HEXA